MAECIIHGTPLPAPIAAAAQSINNIACVARKEIRDSLRNRWFILYTAAFTLLALGLSLVALGGTGLSGFAGFGRTAASLVNLVILIVPLMGLTAGAASIAPERERGTLSYLLAQPVTRTEILLGKYLGLALALAASLAMGFGISAVVLAWQSGAADAGSFLNLVLLSYVLALAMLSLGLLVSVVCPRGSVAFGAAIFLWLTLVFLGDLGLMGSTIAFKLQVTTLFKLVLLNPLQVFKMASLESIHASLDVLGPTGFYASQTFGEKLGFIFAAALSAWIIAPLAAALLLFRWKAAS